MGATGVPVNVGEFAAAASVIPYPVRVVGLPDKLLNAPSKPLGSTELGLVCTHWFELPSA